MLTGDSEAYGELVQRHGPSLLRVLVGIVNDTHLAEDTLQEVLLIAFRRLESFRMESSFRTWIHRIAVRRALGARTRLRKLVRTFAPLAREPSRAHSPELDELEAALALLGRLPPHERAPLALYAAGWSYEEIAELLDCPPGTVATRMNRARKRLADRTPGAAAAPDPAPALDPRELRKEPS